MRLRCAGVYIAGGTSSSSGIATSGTHQPNYGGTAGFEVYGDAFLAKFSPSGGREWGTYLGGSNPDVATSCAVDQAGNIYIAGNTYSSSGIASSGAHQANFGGGTRDAFLAKFSSTGARLWATYYGGSGEENGLGCTVDAQGNPYLCGSTNSSNNIATPNTHKPTLGNESFIDGFLVKFNSDGQRQWGTYYGGSAPFADMAERCLVGKNGEIYLIGRTPSDDGIATSGTHQSTYGGGSGDVFVARLNSQGQREWGTYFGDSGVDDIYAAALDTAGNVVIAGYTSSQSRIATPLSHQPSFAGGNEDGFLALLSPQGQVLLATYAGGELDDQVRACAVSRTNEIYIGGETSSRTRIGTPGTHQPSHYGQGASKDAFLMKFSTQPTALPLGVPPVTWRAWAVRGGLLLQSEEPVLLEIWEAAGRQVSACQVGSEGIRLHALPPGVYIVRDSEGRCTQKVLVSE
ncbi:MAG: SBBP repeat-containing protein [Bacteroidia bacterium]